MAADCRDVYSLYRLIDYIDKTLGFILNSLAKELCPVFFGLSNNIAILFKPNKPLDQLNDCSNPPVTI